MLNDIHFTDKPQPVFKHKLEKMYEKDSLAFGDAPLTFMDIYFINAQMDLMDVISSSLESRKKQRPALILKVAQLS